MRFNELEYFVWERDSKGKISIVLPASRAKRSVRSSSGYG